MIPARRTGTPTTPAVVMPAGTYLSTPDGGIDIIAVERAAAGDYSYWELNRAERRALDMLRRARNGNTAPWAGLVEDMEREDDARGYEPDQWAGLDLFDDTDVDESWEVAA